MDNRSRVTRGKTRNRGRKNDQGRTGEDCIEQGDVVKSGTQDNRNYSQSPTATGDSITCASTQYDTEDGLDDPITRTQASGNINCASSRSDEEDGLGDANFLMSSSRDEQALDRGARDANNTNLGERIDVSQKNNVDIWTEMRGINITNTFNTVSKTVIGGSDNIAASSTATTRVTKAPSSYLPAGEAETNLAGDFSGNEREEYGTNSDACSPLIMNNGIPNTTMPAIENAKGKDYSIGRGANKRPRCHSPGPNLPTLDPIAR